ncbi:MAG: GTP 3',8-cyclase MoaA [Desulfurococcales archaeon]|nr:GTP 3',8-cyclase MoaA [Desulfurococcales archaeon]
MLQVSDPYGRPLTNLRLVVTDECNYRCIFCHMEGEPVEGPRRPGRGEPLLLPADYGIIAAAASMIGVDKFKITGGEPLIRGDIIEIIDSIRSEARQAEISLTTNGFFLERLATRLAEAGLARANISIHSLRESRYRFITSVPGLRRALQGLRAAIDAGIRVKINMVVLAGVNDDEILEMAEFAREAGAVLQLIELHPVGLGAKFFKKYFYPLSRVEKMLLEMGARKTLRELHNRPIYELPSGAIIEIVRPYNNPFFCAGCTRVRIGPYGDILPCINWRGPRPVILPVLRSGLPREEKVLRVAETLIDVVASRRPFFMCSLDNCKETYSSGISRISFPKRRHYREAKQVLRRLLKARGGLQSRVRSP